MNGESTLWDNWGDGERGATEVEAAPKLSAAEAKAFPFGGDWGDGERTPGEPAGTPNDERTSDPIAYLGELPQSFDDVDREIVSTFFSGLEGKVAPEVAQEILSRYETFAGAEDERIAAFDEPARDTAIAELRKEWGDSYDENREQIISAIKSQPFADDLFDARFPDDSAAFNNPAFSRWIFELIHDQARYREMAERFGED